MTSSICERVVRFLDENYPGSRIDDGYSFIAVRSDAEVFIKHDCSQRLANKLCDNPCILVTVGADPSALLGNASVEERVVEYKPDWDVNVNRPQWFVEVSNMHIDLAALFAVATKPGTMALIDLKRRMVLDLHLRVLHATDDETLATFMDEFRDCVAEP